MLDEARREIMETKERDQLRPRHTFSPLPGFFERKAEISALKKILEGDPCFTVLFGASSVGKVQAIVIIPLPSLDSVSRPRSFDKSSAPIISMFYTSICALQDLQTLRVFIRASLSKWNNIFSRLATLAVMKNLRRSLGASRFLLGLIEFGNAVDTRFSMIV